MIAVKYQVVPVYPRAMRAMNWTQSDVTMMDVNGEQRMDLVWTSGGFTNKVYVALSNIHLTAIVPGTRRFRPPGPRSSRSALAPLTARSAGVPLQFGGD